MAAAAVSSPVVGRTPEHTQPTTPVSARSSTRESGTPREFRETSQSRDSNTPREGSHSSARESSARDTRESSSTRESSARESSSARDSSTRETSSRHVGSREAPIIRDPNSDEITKHSVHTLVFRSIKRSHDMFLADHSQPLPPDKKADEAKKKCKLRAEYQHVINPTKKVPLILKDGSLAIAALEPPKIHDPTLAILGTNSFPNAPGVSLCDDIALSKDPSAVGLAVVSSMLTAGKPPSDKDKTAPGVQDIIDKELVAAGIQAAKSKSGESKVPFSTAILPRKATTMPKPTWHPPWKLMRVVSGHTGWVRSISVEPGNQWFCTGSADRTIKIWDLASCKLKLSLTGHISTVRGLVVSPRHPYLFSCADDKTVKCWDLEQNKVVRHYHGHLSAVYCIDIHPTIDVLLTAGRDSTARVWDIRTKSCVHTLVGHTNTVADVKCQGAEPQVVTGSHDSTIRYWDIAAGKSSVTLTNHKKSIRSLVFHPTQYTMASASADNIKQWKFPDGHFIQNLSGHNAILNVLAVNSDGILVSGADNGSMHFWDWRTGYNFQRHQAKVQPGSLDSEAGIFAMTFDHSGTRLLTTEADKTIKIYKEDETATEETHPLNWRPDIIKRKKY